MMYRSLLAVGILVSSIASPLTAYAYLTPEDVLNQDDFSANFYTAPPSRREINAAAEAQRERSAERREAEQAALNSSSSSSSLSSEEDLHGAAPEEPTSNTSSTGNAALTAEELREQRILERIHAQQLAAQYGQEDEVLHSGAPLTAETGPATMLIILAVAAAIGETWRRVRKMEVE